MIQRLLTKVERQVKTDVRYLLKGGSAMMMGQVGVSLIGLATATAFANLLSKDAYGLYQYVITTAEFLTVFSLIGLSRAVVTSTARGFDGTLDHAFKKGLLWGLASVFVGIAVGGYYLFKGNTLLGLGVAIGTALTLLISVAKIYLSFLNGKRLFLLTSAFTVTGLLIPAIAVIGALFLTDNLHLLLAVYFFSNAFANVGLFALSRRYKENNKVDPGVIGQSIHLSAQAWIGRAAGNLDRILLFQFAGPVALAEYWIASNVQRNFSHLLKSANGIVLPKLTTRSFAKLQGSLPGKLLLLYAFIVPFTITYVIATPYIFMIFFPQYLSMVFLSQILGTLFLLMPMQVFADALTGHGMHRELYHITTISSVIKIGATILLVPAFGLWGLVISRFIDETLYALLVLWYFFTAKTPTA